MQRVPGYREVETALASAGLRARGGLEVASAEAVAGPGDDPAACLVLVGAIGDSHWPSFSASPEFADGRRDPLDRWSRRVVGGIAEAFGARPLFPFEGPPYLPFQQWALRAEPLYASPLGLLIHPSYGLWHSYRGALAFRERLPGLPELQAGTNPCRSCDGRPCLSACPVDAFSSAGYDTRACAGHLARPQGSLCLTAACLARAACPVGVRYRYGPAAARFHMAAFEASLRTRHFPRDFGRR